MNLDEIKAKLEAGTVTRVPIRITVNYDDFDPKTLVIDDAYTQEIMDYLAEIFGKDIQKEGLEYGIKQVAYNHIDEKYWQSAVVRWEHV